MRILWSIWVAICLGNLGVAQVQSNVVIQEDSIQLGQTLDVQFKVVTQNLDDIQSLNFSNTDSLFVVYDPFSTSGQPDTIYEFIQMEISDYGNWPANEKEISKDQLEWITGPQGYMSSVRIKGIIWQPGGFALPGIQIRTKNDVNVSYGQPGLIMVTPPTNYVPRDSTEVLADIKPIIEEPIKLEDFMFAIYLGLGLVFLIMAVILYNRHKRNAEKIEVPEPVIVRPAHEIAEEKLDDLKTKQLWQQGLIKEYQSKLTFIIREYLENRYDMKALESTTQEILTDLKKQDFDPTLNNDLREILTMADLVKFAKAKPGENIHESFMQKAYELVSQTKQMPNLEEND